MRISQVLTLTIANGAAVSNAINFTDFTRMIVIMPAAWTAANVGFQVSTTEGGTYTGLYSIDGSVAEIASPAVNLAYASPPEVNGATWLKLWSQNGSGVGVNQAAERTITVITTTE